MTAPCRSASIFRPGHPHVFALTWLVSSLLVREVHFHALGPLNLMSLVVEVYTFDPSNLMSSSPFIVLWFWSLTHLMFSALLSIDLAHFVREITLKNNRLLDQLDVLRSPLYSSM